MKKRLLGPANYTLNGDYSYNFPFTTEILEIIESEEVAITLALFHLQDTTKVQEYITNSLNPVLNLSGIEVWTSIEWPFGYGAGTVADIGHATWDPVFATDPDPLIESPLINTAIPAYPGHAKVWWPNPDQYHDYLVYLAAQPPEFFPFPAVPEAGEAQWTQAPVGRWPSFWWDSPCSEWERRYGAGIDLLNETDTIGFSWELGFETGIDWLRKATDKQLYQYIAVNHTAFGNDDPDHQTWLAPNINRYYESNADKQIQWHNALGWRLSKVDGIMFEVYTPDEGSPDFIPNATWILENHPDASQGMTSAYTEGYPWFWDTDQEVQQDYIRTYFHNFVTALGGLRDIDYIEIASSSTWAPERSDFLESLIIDETVTPEKPVETITSRLVPHYHGASICRNDYPLDTFANTGNEVLLIKSIDGGTHTITVGSYEYQIAVPSTRGTFLGPFPPDVFGSSPTIDYDVSTKLWVALLKNQSYSGG